MLKSSHSRIHALFAIAMLASSAAVAAPPDPAPPPKPSAAPTEREILAREALEDRDTRARKPVFRPGPVQERDRSFEALQAEVHRHRAEADKAETAKGPPK